ncbi:MAG: TraB/GumN family protein [Haloferacaceae archaeon]|jgi:pheromone shutdown protein TraB|nr:TraB/GumN family protein [Haloferacaceae archaeon]
MDTPQEVGNITLVGTAHVSEASVTAATETITAREPAVVAVELDAGRYRQLRGDAPEDLDPKQLLQGNTVFQLLAYWMLSYIQAQLGDAFDIRPGAEMLAAVDTAEAAAIPIALIDRDIAVTMQRFWTKMRRRERLEMLGGLLVAVGTPAGAAGATAAVGAVLIGPLIALAITLTGTPASVLAPVALAGLVVTGAVVVSHRMRAPQVAVGVGTAVVVLTVAGGASPLVTELLSPLLILVVGSATVGVTLGGAVGTVAGARVDAAGVDLAELSPAELTDGDLVAQMLEEFRRFSPRGAEALIDERDAYLAHELRELSARYDDVVAVLGAGHLPGVTAHLREPSGLPPKATLTGRARRRLPIAEGVGVSISAVAIGTFVLLALSPAADAIVMQIFLAWFLINGVAAGGLARLAGARWDAALAGGAIAWLTSVNPLLAPGWIAGYLELRRTPVNIADIGRMNELLGDESRPLRQIVGELRAIPLFRLILIVAATNIGSIIASVAFVTYLLPQFAVDLGGADAVVGLLLEGARTGWEILAQTVGV